MTAKNKLKIALVLDDSLDKTDGVQQYVLTVGKRLAELGHEVHYLVGATKRRDIPRVHSLSRNVGVRFNKNRMSMPLPANRRRIKQLLRREDFDIIHVQMPFSPFLAGRIIRAAGPRTSVVGTFHIAPHSRMVTLANRFLGLWTRRTLRRFNKIVSVSAVAQDFAKRTYGIESSVLPNTIDLAPFYKSSQLKQYDGLPVVVFLGRLVERKGCQHLLRAAAYLHNRDLLPEGCKIIVCGTGPLEAGLKSYVQMQRMIDIVDFVGYISEDDKSKYLASGDVVAFPSTGGESFGIVLLEAMAATPGVVLAGNNPGYASVMAEKPELLFDPRDEKHLAGLIAEYLSDDKKRQSMHLWQQQYVDRYDAKNVTDQILQMYRASL
jgi:phosphatidyl-myo-inositol alpha-mannosyltransferase